MTRGQDFGEERARDGRQRWRRLALATALLLLALGAAAWYSRDAVLAGRGEPLRCELPAQARDAPHPGMVWVPGGSFELGDTVYPEEQPLRQTRVDGLWMDRTVVTNDRFARFVAATGYVTVAERALDAQAHPDLPPEMLLPGAVVFMAPSAVDDTGNPAQWWRYVAGANWRHPGGPATTIEGRGSFPVVTVTYQDALAYARWIGHVLPSEAQWEWAARAGQTRAAQDHEQPRQANTWQGRFPVENRAEDGFKGLAPVGCFAPNALGLYDMIGNVWQITADAYRPNHLESNNVAPDQMQLAMRPASGLQRVIKGGSYLCAPNYCRRYRSGSRQPQEEDLGAAHVGFRTVLPP